MNKTRIILYSLLFLSAFAAWLFSYTENSSEVGPEATKVSIRDVGNQLLLANDDSTSLVLPVKQLESSKYRLSFEKELSINPDSLVTIVKSSIKRGGLPDYYIVEVIQCSGGEVAYSYKMRNEMDKSIVPCASRVLPLACYTLEVSFINNPVFSIPKQVYLILMLIIALFFSIEFILTKRKKAALKNSTDVYSLGIFTFYPEQNKLTKAAKDISLSRKECELLAIFVANPNQIIKRDELTKRVWEDNGVIVGRSLDTYISKLRKILSEDQGITITNVHGVGYKLEVR